MRSHAACNGCILQACQRKTSARRPKPPDPAPSLLWRCERGHGVDCDAQFRSRRAARCGERRRRLGVRCFVANCQPGGCHVLASSDSAPLPASILLLCQSTTIHVCSVQGLRRLPRIVRRLVLRQTPPIDRFVANGRPLFRLRPGWIRWRRSQQVEVWICTQTIAAVSRDWQRCVAVDGPLRNDAWSAREVGRVRRVPRFEALLARPVLRTHRCPGPSTTLQRSPTASTGAWERQRGLVRAFVIRYRVASSRHTTRGGPMLKQTCCCVCWRSRLLEVASAHTVHFHLVLLVRAEGGGGRANDGRAVRARGHRRRHREARGRGRRRRRRGRGRP